MQNALQGNLKYHQKKGEWAGAETMFDTFTSGHNQVRHCCEDLMWHLKSPEVNEVVGQEGEVKIAFYSSCMKVHAKECPAGT